MKGPLLVATSVKLSISPSKTAWLKRPDKYLPAPRTPKPTKRRGKTNGLVGVFCHLKIMCQISKSLQKGWKKYLKPPTRKIFASAELLQTTLAAITVDCLAHWPSPCLVVLLPALWVGRAAGLHRYAPAIL